MANLPEKRLSGGTLSLQQMTLQENNSEVRLKDIMSSILGAKRTIIFCVLAGLLIGWLAVVCIKPVYEAHSLLQIDTSISGVQTQNRTPEPQTPTVTPGFVSNPASEIEIIRSQVVLGPVISQLHLDIAAEPHYFPFIGAAIANARIMPDGRSGVLDHFGLRGLGHYAWGGEKIIVDRLDVPKRLENRPLRLVAGENGQFRLLGPDHKLLLTGEVGRLASSPQVGINIRVQDLAAHSGGEFTVSKISPLLAMNALKERLLVRAKADAGSSNDSKGGIIEMQLQGGRPNEISNTLNAIMKSYQLQNIDFRSEDAQRKIAFLNRQIPLAQKKLNDAEIALRDFRSQHTTIAPTGEADAAIKQAADIQKDLMTVKLQLAELREKYTDNHPAIIVLKKKMADLQQQLENGNAHIRTLPFIEQNTVKLERNAKVASELYLQLVKEAQELQIIEAGKMSNVRTLEQAITPIFPIKPNSKLLLEFAGLGGLLLGCLIGFFRSPAAANKIKPTEFEQLFGVPVYATIPHSRSQSLIAMTKREQKPQLLAAYATNDIAIERLRDLRTHLHFLTQAATGSIVSITSPCPHAGKTFVALNLSFLLAHAGKKVLLIDGDIRCGKLGSQLNISPDSGLTDVLSGKCQASSAIHETGTPCLDFMACGKHQVNASELLMSEKFRECIQQLAAGYDWVILDTPPILAVTDALLVSAVANINLLVVPADAGAISSVDQSVSRFAHNGILLSGLVINDFSDKGGKRKDGGYYPYAR